MDILRKDLRPFLLSSLWYFDKRVSYGAKLFFSKKDSEKNKTNLMFSAHPSVFKNTGVSVRQALCSILTFTLPTCSPSWGKITCT